VYARGCGIQDGDGAGIAPAVALAKTADVAVLVMGEAQWMSGEAASRTTIDIPGRQEELIKAIVATGKPVVLVLMNGRTLAIGWEAAHVPAILETWFLGTKAGNAIADVLFGDSAPTGRLPVTFPRVSGQVPLYYNFKNTGRPFVDSMKYTTHYLDVASTPLYPFGYGLTYTSFAYDGLRMAKKTLGVGDTLRVTVNVRNTGAREGDEVVQLYVRDDVGSVTRPVRELKAFARVHVKKGETIAVPLVVAINDLAFTGLDMQKKVEPGTFHVYVGPNAGEGLVETFDVR
jgi:beta-glucosidase